MGQSMCSNVHRKSTPLRKPRKRGGSPSGGSEPPQLAAREKKNKKTGTLKGRAWVALITRRIKTIEAPVVPRRLADKVPKVSSAELVAGVPTRLPLTLMPPATTNRVNRRMMKGR